MRRRGWISSGSGRRMEASAGMEEGSGGIAASSCWFFEGTAGEDSESGGGGFACTEPGGGAYRGAFAVKNDLIEGC